MNRILTELPMCNNKVEWNKIINTEVVINYNNENYLIVICDYNTKNQKLKILYNDNKYYMRTGHFKECKFGRIFGIYTSEFKYNVGDIFKNDKRNIQITEKFNNSNKKERKYYKFKCLNCGYNHGQISESNLKLGGGCPVCCKNPCVVIRGVNDISTTATWMMDYFKNKNDAYNHTYSSRDKIIMKCPICGTEKKMNIYSLFYDGFSCICSDGISYPEKFLYNMLTQLNVDFEYQKTFNWSKKYKNKLQGSKKYDFYFRTMNLQFIVEMNGIQHYEENSIFSNTLYEEQINDKFKENLAKQNGIDKYVIIDCRKSTLEFIKNNILDSILSKHFNLEKIDWLECEKFACNSLVKVTCDLWNSGINNATQISKIMHICRTTACKYLKQGSKIKLCDYNPKDAQYFSRKQSKNAKEIICIETKQIYSSVKKATETLHINNISACCRGVRDIAGGFHWMFYEDFIKEEF